VNSRVDGVDAISAQVNGKVFMEPTEARFKDLQKAILRCPRPLKLTFIHVPCGVLVIASTASRER